MLKYSRYVPLPATTATFPLSGVWVKSFQVTPSVLGLLLLHGARTDPDRHTSHSADHQLALTPKTKQTATSLKKREEVLLRSEPLGNKKTTTLTQLRDKSYCLVWGLEVQTPKDKSTFSLLPITPYRSSMISIILFWVKGKNKTNYCKKMANLQNVLECNTETPVFDRPTEVFPHGNIWAA